jgi:hypothetical protein
MNPPHNIHFDSHAAGVESFEGDECSIRETHHIQNINTFQRKRTMAGCFVPQSKHVVADLKCIELNHYAANRTMPLIAKRIARSPQKPRVNCTFKRFGGGIVRPL